MANNPDAKDRSLETLDFIINVLKEHEMNLDNTIDELSTVVEQIDEAIAGLKGKVEGSEEKISNLQKEVTNLIGNLSNAPKKRLAGRGKTTSASDSGSNRRILGSYSRRALSDFAL